MSPARDHATHGKLSATKDIFDIIKITYIIGDMCIMCTDKRFTTIHYICLMD